MIGRMSSGGRRGAYGFRLVSACSSPLPDLATVAEDAPEVRLAWHEASSLLDARELSAGAVVLAQRAGGRLTVTRDPASVDSVGPWTTTAEAMVHPIGTLGLALLASWRGHVTLHAGAVVIGGRAWVVCGERTAGKSSLLAMLASRGVPVLSDDLVVIDGRDVLAGPDCVDLRPDTARRFPGSRSMGVVVDRHRYRLSTDPSPPAAPLAGVWELEWSDDAEPLTATALTTQERLNLLLRQHYAGLLGPPDHDTVFDMLEIPMWRVRRPRDWSAADQGVEALLRLALG